MLQKESGTESWNLQFLLTQIKKTPNSTLCSCILEGINVIVEIFIRHIERQGNERNATSKAWRVTRYM